MRRVFLLWVLSAFLPVGAGLAAVPIRIQTDFVAGESPDTGKVTLRLIPQKTTEAAHVASIAVPGETVLEVPAGITWQVLTESAQLWSAPQWIAPSKDQTELLLTVRLFPSATLTGVLKASPEERQPSALDLRLEASPDAVSPKPPAATVQCPIQKERFRCTVPAGRLDLRIRAESFIPAYLWNIDIAAGQERDLGDFPLRTGASVVGWVRTDDAKGSGGARVRLEPQALGVPRNPGSAEALRAMALETRTNPRGFFQLQEVSPGLAVVTAEKEGFARASRLGIEVRDGLEAQIMDPLILSSPLTFRLTLDPPVDPTGAAWKVVLNRKSEIDGVPNDEVYRGDVSPEGAWEQKGLTPGKFQLSVSEGETPWLFQEVEITSEQTAAQFSIPGVRIRGQVLLGDEPMQATVFFGGRSAPRRARFESDSEGNFEGLLPDEGSWSLELFSEKEQLRLKLDPVEVRKLPGKSHAVVDIRVPDTRLQGRVLDEQGRAVPRALVLIQPTRRLPSTVESDSEGVFEVRGLPPGSLVVHAEEGDRESEWLQAHVAEEDDTPSLRLVLRRQLTVEGRVFSSQGPAPGARVEAVAELGEVGAASGDDAVTGPAGEFTLKLPAGTRMMNLYVLAPGFATRMIAVPLGDKPVLEIPLEPIGGTLIFDFGDRTLDEVLGTRSGLLAHGGTFIPFGVAARWARMQRAPQIDQHRLVLPNMEAGEYLLCFGPEANKAVTKGQEPPASQCTRGYLPPLQELTLPVPAIPGSPSDPPKLSTSSTVI